MRSIKINNNILGNTLSLYETAPIIQGLVPLITIDPAADHVDMNLNMQGPQNILVSGLNFLSFENNWPLRVSNYTALDNVFVNPGSTVTIDNHYSNHTKVDATLYMNSQLFLTGEEFPISVTLFPSSTVWFWCNGHNYHFNNPATINRQEERIGLHHLVMIGNMPELVTMARFLDDKFGNDDIVPVALNEYGTFRNADSIYKNLIKQFMQQNGMNFNEGRIDYFIKSKFFELTAIAHETVIPNPSISLEQFDLMANVVEYLTLNDVDLSVPVAGNAEATDN